MSDEERAESEEDLSWHWKDEKNIGPKELTDGHRLTLL